MHRRSAGCRPFLRRVSAWFWQDAAKASQDRESDTEVADPDTDTEANNIRQSPRSPTVVRDVRDLETAMDKDKEDLEVRRPPADGSSQDGAQAAEAEEKELQAACSAMASAEC